MTRARDDKTDRQPRSKDREKPPSGKPPRPASATTKPGKKAGETRPQGGKKTAEPKSSALAIRQLDSEANRAPVPDAETAATKAEPQGEKNKSKDLLYVYRQCESSQGYQVIRQRSDRLEVGEIHEAQQGKPIAGELVKLSPNPAHERLYDVETLVDAAPQPSRSTGAGPAQVANKPYRDNWEHIFGAKKRRKTKRKSELN